MVDVSKLLVAEHIHVHVAYGVLSEAFTGSQGLAVSLSTYIIISTCTTWSCTS